MSKYLDSNGLLYFWQKVKVLLNGKVDKIDGKGLSTNDYTSAEKTKLAGIDDGANKTIVDNAMSSSSTNPVQNKVIFQALQNVEITVDSEISSSSVHPVQNKVIHAALGEKVDKIDGKGLSTNDYTTAEKTKLSGIEDGANKITVDTALSSSSMNPVQNKVINTALGNKVDKVTGKGLSTNDYTTAEKTKLSGIEENANNYSLPTASGSVLGGVKVGTNLSISDDGVLAATDTTYSDATTSEHGLMSAADKAKLNAFSAASEYAKKTDIAHVYRYKGTVATYADLPTSGMTDGDVYNVESDGQNYAWVDTGSSSTSHWDSLGEVFNIESITNSEIDNILAS